MSRHAWEIFKNDLDLCSGRKIALPKDLRDASARLSCNTVINHRKCLVYKKKRNFISVLQLEKMTRGEKVRSMIWQDPIRREKQILSSRMYAILFSPS